MSRFFVFEGLDGSGKSSLMEAFERELTQRQIAFCHTCEPGGTDLGRQLRPLILRRDITPPVPRAELLMYEADRAQHVEEILRPQLKAGVWVLSDRYKASSIAFQSAGRAISETDVEWLNQFATGGLDPDLTVLLDLTVEQARSRRQGRSSEDRIEVEADAFHERVRTGFLKQAKSDPAHWLVLSAAEAPQKLLDLLLTELRRRKWLD